MTLRCENYMTSRWLAACEDRLRQSLMATPQVFVQADSDLMLARRITRDTRERGRSVDGILEQ
jgi:uridine kinase